MATNIVIDPVTRIEGHLRIEAELGGVDGKTVQRAYSSSTMARGIEIIMQGRDPRDACHISQRICGVCTVVHGLTSVRAIEDALGVKVPENAELIRNMMIGAQYIHDHVMHFYHLHALDWVDVESALTADPAATAALAKANNPVYYANVSEADLAVQFQGVITKLNNLKVNGQLGGLFKHGYWGHPAYKLPAIGNLLAVKHYLDALGWAREIVKLHTIFGGKDPHPNLVVGGVPCSVSSNYEQQASEDRGGTSLNRVNMLKVSDLIDKMQAFVDNVYVPDTQLIAGFYKSAGNYVGWEKRGGTGGNFLCYGEFIETNVDDPANFLIPRGVILNGDLGTVQNLDMENTAEIQEYVAHSWYSYLNDNNAGLHPSIGETKLDYAARNGPAPGAGYALNTGVDDGYSWIKSPRWYDEAMEVGPLAHVVMMYAVAKDNPVTDAEIAHKQAKDLVDAVWRGALGLELADIDSTLGRIAARTIETSVIAAAMHRWQTKLTNNIEAGNLATFVSDAEVVSQNSTLSGFKWTMPVTWNNQNNPVLHGVGFTEAPRGALGHWVSIEGGKIKNYQCIVASQWNAGPRDANGIPGPYEASLVGHSLAVPDQPLEILRTIHSFDPCIGCAVHVTDPNGEELIKVNISASIK